MSEAEEDEAFAQAYIDACGEANYYSIARVLSGRLRQMDKRARAANQRADALEAQLKAKSKALSDLMAADAQLT